MRAIEKKYAAKKAQKFAWRYTKMVFWIYMPFAFFAFIIDMKTTPALFTSHFMWWVLTFFGHFIFCIVFPVITNLFCFYGYLKFVMKVPLKYFVECGSHTTPLFNYKYTLSDPSNLASPLHFHNRYNR